MMYRLIATLTNGGVYEKEYNTFSERWRRPRRTSWITLICG